MPTVELTDQELALLDAAHEWVEKMEEWAALTTATQEGGLPQAAHHLRHQAAEATRKAEHEVLAALKKLLPPPDQEVLARALRAVAEACQGSTPQPQSSWPISSGSGSS